MVLHTFTTGSGSFFVEEPTQGIKLKNVNPEASISIKEHRTGKSAVTVFHSLKVKYLVSNMVALTNGKNQIKYDKTTGIFTEFWLLFSPNGNLNFSEDYRYEIIFTQPTTRSVEVSEIMNNVFGMPLRLKKQHIKNIKEEQKLGVRNVLFMFFETTDLFSSFSTPVLTQSGKVIEFTTDIEQVKDSLNAIKNTYFETVDSKLENGVKDGLVLPIRQFSELTFYDASSLQYYYTITLG